MVDGFPGPDHPEDTTTHLICTTDDDQVINIDGSREEILSHNDFYSGPHQTQLSLPNEILLEDSEGMDGMYVHVNRETLDKIKLINQPQKSPRWLQATELFPSRLGTEYDDNYGVVQMPGGTPYVNFYEDDYVTYNGLNFGTSGTTKSIIITYINGCFNCTENDDSGYFMELWVDGPGGPVEIGEFVPTDRDGLYVPATTNINIDDVDGIHDLTFAGRGGNVGMSIYEFRLSPYYSSENDYQISLIDGSIDVAFNDSRFDKEIMMNLNITTGNIDDLSNPIKVFDYDTCNTTEYDSAMLVASAMTNFTVPDASTRDIFSAVPVEIDLNTTYYSR